MGIRICLPVHCLSARPDRQLYCRRNATSQNAHNNHLPVQRRRLWPVRHRTVIPVAMQVSLPSVCSPSVHTFPISPLDRSQNLWFFRSYSTYTPLPPPHLGPKMGPQIALCFFTFNKGKKVFLLLSQRAIRKSNLSEMEGDKEN